MQLKTYNLAMLGATIVAWLSFFLVVSNFDPQEANAVVLIFFYFSLFLSTLGSLALIGFWWRKIWRHKKELSHKVAAESFRQATIFSTALIIALLLQATRLLTWWNIILLILVATMIEFLILVFRDPHKN
jgi:hypothetical protein